MCVAVAALLFVLALGWFAFDLTSVSAAQDGAISGSTANDPCAASGLVAVGATGLCTHGPDDPISGGDAGAAESPFAAAAIDPSITCIGTGSDGNRVEVLYVRTSDVPRRAGFAATVRGVAARADQIYRDSAAETGGSRSIRFVHNAGAGCVISVTEVVVSPTARASFAETIDELAAKGYDRTDRKYLMFMDADAICGIGTVVPDDRRDPSNRNNVGPSYSRVDLPCWSPDLAAHELMHNLGGVQDTAPNASLGGHCVDEYDIMCYADPPYYPAMRIACPDPAGNARRFDCNHDDYFNTNPPPSNYLATRWNSANNQFLIGAVAQPALPPPANDDFDRATEANARTYSDAKVIVSSATAAHDDPSPTCIPFAQSASVWYKTTATTSGPFVVDSLGSRYRTVLSVWTGQRGNLTEVACDAHGEQNGQSRVPFTAEATTTYYIMVGSYYTPGASELTVSLTGPVAEAVSSAVTLSKGKSKYNGSVVATLTGFAPGSSVTLHWPHEYEIASGPEKGQLTTRLASGTTDGSGRAALAFRTPLEPLGDYALTARDAAGGTAAATFRVIPRILLNEVAGPSTTNLRVYFYGFAAGDRIEVRWCANGSPTSSALVIKTLTVTGNGRTSSLVTIPRNAAPGTHVIVGKVVGVSRSASTPFLLTSQALSGQSVDDGTATPTRTKTITATPESSPAAVSTATATFEPSPVTTPEPTSTPELTPEPTATLEPATETPTAEPIPEPTTMPEASPVADAGNDQTLTDTDASGDEQVSLDGSASTDPAGGPLTYIWSVDGTQVATDPAATLTLPVGATTVVLTVTEAAGAIAIDEVVVTITSPTDGEAIPPSE